MATFWFIPAVACYVVSAVLFVGQRRAGLTRAGGLAVGFLAAGAVLHALDLAARGIAAGNIPVSNFAGALSFLAWLTALFGLVMIVRVQLAVIGAFVASGVTLAFAIASVMQIDRPIRLPDTLRSIWLPIHVTLAIFGYALFVLAASVSI
ncbi:MAG TPA: cytochrome c biogenesis protein CcsA, partial [Candidatus Binataceae bacterium]|nr:cytochrome c biogenesis protein CcsA [Candidatus Binataceae bacterium]